ncbi:hypothetical protein KUCAC02_024563 [Chaenocephalus aceratus]|uniref:Uncharacterized protein n=1 Tax=Chaenocephalus aceratus TaxID=36190 RepID=A0ACB9WI91_CHAAC|nr:hypothetical protein KUCAC02_024563 [Chaenocephalus aceratus]
MAVHLRLLLILAGLTGIHTITQISEVSVKGDIPSLSHVSMTCNIEIKLNIYEKEDLGCLAVLKSGLIHNVAQESFQSLMIKS